MKDALYSNHHPDSFESGFFRCESMNISDSLCKSNPTVIQLASKHPLKKIKKKMQPYITKRTTSTMNQTKFAMQGQLQQSIKPNSLAFNRCLWFYQYSLLDNSSRKPINFLKKKITLKKHFRTVTEKKSPWVPWWPSRHWQVHRHPEASPLEPRRQRLYLLHHSSEPQEPDWVSAQFQKDQSYPINQNPNQMIQNHSKQTKIQKCNHVPASWKRQN